MAGAIHGARLSDQKREGYRQYLEQEGVIESLTRVLAGLMDEGEKPDDPIKYVATELGFKADDMPSLDALENQLSTVKAENYRLTKENADLRAEIDKFKSHGSLGSPPPNSGRQKPRVTHEAVVC